MKRCLRTSAWLANVSALAFLASGGSVCAQTATFSGTDTTNGPFSSGTQSFHDFSALNALTAGTVSGGTQNFSDQSALNALVANAISGGTQNFKDDTRLNASAQNAISDGVQNFSWYARLNATAAGAVSGGVQTFAPASSLQASAENAVVGGKQFFQGTSVAEALAARAIAGGEQDFSGSSRLDVRASEGLAGGTQIFHGQSQLIATEMNSVIGGTQSFRDQSNMLDYSTGGVFSGGTQNFFDQSYLYVARSNSLSGGVQSFYDDSYLFLGRRNALSGGSQNFYGNSELRAATVNAVAGGTQTFHDNSKIQIGATNALSRSVQLTFDNSAGGTGGTLNMNGFATTVGGLQSNSAGAGRVTNNRSAAALLTVDTSVRGSTEFSGIIQDGTGGVSLLKTGAGAFTLSGNNSYTGATTVNDGTLVVNGTIAQSSLTNVQSGARLGGSGTVGNTSIASGGTLAPGNSIGTLSINGNLVTAKGSLFEVEVAPNGSSDRVAVTGTATLGGGTVARISMIGAYDPTTVYTILTAQNGVTGRFEGATSNFVFLDSALGYTSNAVTLSFKRNDFAFEDAGITRNQRATGSALDTLGLGNGVLNKVVQFDVPTARIAFDQLSGEINASAVTGLIEDSRFLRNAASDRIRAAFGNVGASTAPVTAYGANGPVLAPAAAAPGVAVWSSAYGSWGKTDSDRNAVALDRAIGGVLVGADAAMLDDWRIGVLGGYSHSSVQADARASSASIDSYHLGVYGGRQWNALSLRSGVAYSLHDIDTSRRVAFTGFSDSLSGSYHANMVQAFGELGYAIDIGPGRIEPFANLAHVSLRTDGFTERGGAAALIGQGDSTDTTFTTLGLRSESGIALGAARARLTGMLGWRYAVGDIVPEATQAFAGSRTFTVAGAPIARNALAIEAGVGIDLTSNAALGISYQGQIANEARDHGLKAQLNFRF